ncbi:hypothetical protein [Ureibacillus manganicus]|uniref:Uncharacterized protein n=1 Tax=Ureibacillus manganicus DSM 26584 TaxID=1384049 RepID=A0A0A3IC69_9BACL|nr:hypothetical protein [Ureibacillus manganicus]KGR80413.1 hypothetical protein CD29_00535 [Ureibacillus manganicus DSM 26584]
MSSIQISHACAILLSTMFFPLSLVIIEFFVSGNFSGEGFAIVMAIVGPIFFVIGPIIGIIVHLFKVRDFSKKIAVYSIAGIILGLCFYLYINNGNNIGWFLFAGLLMTIIYCIIQFTTEKMIRKLLMNKGID